MTDIEFWDWFKSKRAEIERFIARNTSDYSIYDELRRKLKSYNGCIIPELTKDTKENNVMVLSCDGMRAGIPHVERLCESAPKIEKWKFQKFRKTGDVTELHYQGLQLSSSDIRVKHKFDGRYYDVELFIQGYVETDQRYKSIAFLFLDHLVGEYNVMTKIEQIEFKKLAPGTSTTDKLSLEELRAIVGD